MGFEDFLKDILGGGASSSRHAQQMPQMPDLPPVGHGEEGIGGIMHAVVQIVALKQGLMGGMSSAWTGSGTIVHPAGVILTNCHVANPRAMGMSSPSADRLGISITERSDAPPALTYFAQIVAQAPELDLAVVRIISTVNGQRVGNLNLPCVEIGDSDRLELGDPISILGYPGIGGETVTFTSGNVSGFSSERGVNATRAWVKTDATIAGGNSGGTAVNKEGFLVGIPTQAAAGTGITPVDARPVLDTNRDGRIDQRDTPMAIGGFINGLRPVNLAISLLEQAGMQFEQDRGQRRRQAAVRPAEPVDEYARHMDPPPPKSDESNFRELLFSGSVTEDGRPINPVAQIPEGAEQIYATFEYSGMNPGTPWSAVWTKDGQIIIEQKEGWDDDRAGRKAIKINKRGGVPAGEYHLILGIGSQVALEGKIHVGSPVDQTDSQVSGTVVDSQSGRPIPDATVIILKPGASARQFVRQDRRSMVLTNASTNQRGQFTLPSQLPKGNAYSFVVASRAHQILAVEGALRIGPGAPESADMGNIPLDPLR